MILFFIEQAQLVCFLCIMPGNYFWCKLVLYKYTHLLYICLCVNTAGLSLITARIGSFFLPWSHLSFKPNICHVYRLLFFDCSSLQGFYFPKVSLNSGVLYPAAIPESSCLFCLGFTESYTTFTSVFPKARQLCKGILWVLKRIHFYSDIFGGGGLIRQFTQGWTQCDLVSRNLKQTQNCNKSPANKMLL